jgi:hypothetical protein
MNMHMDMTMDKDMNMDINTDMVTKIDTCTVTNNVMDMKLDKDIKDKVCSCPCPYPNLWVMSVTYPSMFTFSFVSMCEFCNAYFSRQLSLLVSSKN